MAFFDDAFQIDDEILAVLARDLHFAFVGEIAETAGANNRLADGVSLIGRNFLRPLPFDRPVNINFAARFFADVIDRDDDRGVIVIFPLERGLDGIGQLFAGLPAACTSPM